MYRAAGLEQFGWLEHFFGTAETPALAVDQRTATLKQVHSRLVIRVQAHDGCLGEGDALVTNEPGIWLAVRTADCYPIILADPIHHAIGVVHAGWRGAAAEIVSATIDTMACQFSTGAKDLHVGIGPGIGKCCFEVEAGVADRFTQWLGQLALGETAKTHVDLGEVLRRQLERLGVVSHQMELNGCCTKCGGQQFHSYRREGEKAGRMVSAARIAA